MSESTSDDGLPPLREVIERHQLAAKKSLGQNFLFDLNLTRRIARAAAPLQDATIVEIGPGPGGLTRALLAEGAKHVIAIERDPRAMPALQQIADHYPGRLTLIEIVPSMGKGPQNLAIAPGGELLLCANAPGNSVALFRIDSQTGRLTSAGLPTELTSPMCIMILP